MPKPRIKGTPQSLAFAPAEWEVADAGALQALQRGDATKAQQQRALRFIVERIACTYDQPFRPGHDGQTDFACGKMFVGQQIVKLLNVNLAPHLREPEKPQLPNS